jgi:hypothetical protein
VDQRIWFAATAEPSSAGGLLLYPVIETLVYGAAIQFTY